MELIGIAADESERQRETLPRAVRRVSYRVIFYYVGAITVLGLNVSAKDQVLQSFLSSGGYSSPFVLMVQRAGIPRLAHVINSVALISVASVANANLYVSVCFFVSQVDCRAVLCMHLPRRNKLHAFSKKRIIGMYHI